MNAEFTGRVAELFPQGVVSFQVRGTVSPKHLLKDELECIARAGDRRVQDFSAGRLCARAALSALGLPETPLLRGLRGAPAWPSGMIGTISHTNGYCVAVVSRTTLFSGLGVDVERVGHLQDSLWPVLFRPEEIDFLEAMCERKRPSSATTMFTAKEAFYKCQYSLTRRWLNFQDVLIDLVDDIFHVTVCKGVDSMSSIGCTNGRFMQDGDLIVSGIAINSQPTRA